MNGNRLGMKNYLRRSSKHAGLTYKWAMRLAVWGSTYLGDAVFDSVLHVNVERLYDLLYKEFFSLTLYGAA